MRIFNGISGHLADDLGDQLEGAVQAELSTTIEVEGGAKPACVVESIVRYIA